MSEQATQIIRIASRQPEAIEFTQRENLLWQANKRKVHETINSNVSISDWRMANFDYKQRVVVCFGICSALSQKQSKLRKMYWIAWATVNLLSRRHTNTVQHKQKRCHLCERNRLKWLNTQKRKERREEFTKPKCALYLPTCNFFIRIQTSLAAVQLYKFAYYLLFVWSKTVLQLEWESM